MIFNSIMDFIQSKKFPYIVAFSAGLVAFSAAFFSVFGLSKLFAGAQLSVVIMAGSLEFAKLVTASFLYRYWNTTPKFLKNYLLLGTLVLILITSAGIFGYLSNAYQGATTGFEKQSTSLIYKEDQLEQLKEDTKFLKDEMETAINELPENYRTARRKMRADYQPQIKELNKQMLDLKGEIGDLKLELVETGVDVGPAIYLARIFDTEVDNVVKWFILILIFVFDPLAVSLVIAANMAFELNSNKLSSKEPEKEPEKKEKKKKWWEFYGDKKEEDKKPNDMIYEEDEDGDWMPPEEAEVSGSDKVVLKGGIANPVE